MRYQNPNGAESSWTSTHGHIPDMGSIIAVTRRRVRNMFHSLLSLPFIRRPRGRGWQSGLDGPSRWRCTGPNGLGHICTTRGNERGGVGGVDDEVDEDEPVGDVDRRDGLREVELISGYAISLEPDRFSRDVSLDGTWPSSHIRLKDNIALFSPCGCQ